MFSRGSYMDGGDWHALSTKRPRLFESSSPLYGGSVGPNLMSNTSGYSYPREPPPFPVVRLRGLPFDCTETDVAEFFRDLDVVDVLFVHKGGRFTGEAFCVLGCPVQVDYAMQRNKQSMGRRYIEVFQSKRQEYYHAVANEVSGTSGASPKRSAAQSRARDEAKEKAVHTGVLRLRGLPYSAGKDDIVEFFDGFDITDEDVHIVMNSEGRPSGEAYVEFSDSDQSKAAMVKDKMTLGTRYVELFPSSSEEMDEALSKRK